MASPYQRALLNRGAMLPIGKRVIMIYYEEKRFFFQGKKKNSHNKSNCVTSDMNAVFASPDCHNLSLDSAICGIRILLRLKNAFNDRR